MLKRECDFFPAVHTLESPPSSFFSLSLASQSHRPYGPLPFPGPRKDNILKQPSDISMALKAASRNSTTLLNTHAYPNPDPDRHAAAGHTIPKPLTAEKTQDWWIPRHHAAFPTLQEVLQRDLRCGPGQPGSICGNSGVSWDPGQEKSQKDKKIEVPSLRASPDWNLILPPRSSRRRSDIAWRYLPLQRARCKDGELRDLASEIWNLQARNLTAAE